MKLQNTPNYNLNTQNIKNKDTSQMSFTGGEALTQALTFLQTNQAVGATFVDAAFMCTPRTIVDFTRGPEAGIETARREFASNFNDAALGAYGMGAAFLLAQGINNKYGIKANKMFVDDDTLSILSDIRYKHGDIKNSEAKLTGYLNEILSTTKGFDPNNIKNADAKGWVKIDSATQKDIVKRIVAEVKENPEKISKETKNYIKALLVRATGSESEIKLEREILNSKNEKEIVKSVTSVDDFINNIFRVTKSFRSDKVAETFKSSNILNNPFIKSLKGLNAKTAILGIAICSVIGASVQPINMYLTKKKTGKSGFVGGGEEDKSKGFVALKIGVAAAFAAAAARSIGPFSQILSKIQFKGLVPTIPQFKLAYGITIVSRLLSARNKNELRESSIKDSLGFANWLILGGFVSKWAAMGLEKLMKGEKFIKYNAAENGEGFFKKLIKSSILTREEVLHDAFKKAKISPFKEINGKKVAMTFKEMLKLAAEKTPAARAKTRYLGVIQLIGYAYSALVLGIGIPKLNIAITNAVEKKNKKQEPAQQDKIAA